MRTLLMTQLLSVAHGFAIWPTIVRQGTCKLQERFGSYRKTLDPGLHWTIPLVDRCRTIPTVEIVLDTPPQNCITQDNAPLKADAVLYYKIFDPVLAAYGVQSLNLAIANLVKTQVRAEIGKLDLDSTFGARDALSQTLLENLDKATDPWGVQVTRVELKEIAPNPDILRSMESVMSAERDKRALILRSEGERAAQQNAAAGLADAAVQAAEADKISVVLAAEASASSARLAADAEADATRARGQAQRDSLQLVQEALGGSSGGSSDAAMRLEILRQYHEATATLAASPNAKTLLLPRSDEWLGRIGVAIAEADLPNTPN